MRHAAAALIICAATMSFLTALFCTLPRAHAINLGNGSGLDGLDNLSHSYTPAGRLSALSASASEGGAQGMTILNTNIIYYNINTQNT